MSFGILIFVLAILLIVMVHESGHFLVAKLFGFKAPQFFVGFGPTVWSFKKGETEYGLKAIPAGGFVKIIGMNPYEEIPPEDQPRSYPNKPLWQRALLLVAGSATHWLMAFVALFITAMTIGFPTNQPTNQVLAIQQGSPADQAGLEPGDRIVAVDGQETTSWDDVRSFIQAHPGDRATFSVERDGDSVEVVATIGSALFNAKNRPVAIEEPGEPLRDPKPGEHAAGFLGVEADVAYKTYGPIEALSQAGKYTWVFTHRAFTGIDDIFAPVVNGELWEALQGEGERGQDSPIGVVGASRIAGESVERGRYLDLISLIVGFTILIGILNLLPLPPLDGGHLAVVAYEAITGSTVDIRKLIPVAAVVISFFVLLFLAVLYLDIARPVDIPF
jgi:membrane-associated protease RseP (regulator of RpoE activity)